MEKLVLDEAALSEKLPQCETLDEAYAAVRGAGVEISKEEFARIVAEAQTDELNEEALDDVAGGSGARRHRLAIMALKNFLRNSFCPLSKWK